LTLWTHQELGSWAERAVLPSVLGMVMFGSGSMEQVNDPDDPDHALANGQFILVSRAAYDALGGHDALRGEILDDVTFARRLKADGRFRLLVADGQHLVRVRMYTSPSELWEGFTKNMYLGARGDVRVLATAATFLGFLSVVPAGVAASAWRRTVSDGREFRAASPGMRRSATPYAPRWCSTRRCASSAGAASGGAGGGTLDGSTANTRRATLQQC
jgi:hypothetical protein